jgi:hypothetical protein
MERYYFTIKLIPGKSIYKLTSTSLAVYNEIISGIENEIINVNEHRVGLSSLWYQVLNPAKQVIKF